jgi:hypothetical protein
MNSYFYTIYGYYGEGLEMHNNKITNDSAMYTYAYGPYLYYVDKFNVSSNYIGTNMNYGYYYGMLLAYGVGYNSPRSVFANNCIYAGSTTATSYGYYGAYMYGTGNMDFHHNSVTRKGQSNYQYAYAGYFGNAGNVTLKNNVFNDQSGCVALYAQGGFTLAESDHNAFYSTNATPIYFNNAFLNSFETYQQVSGFDENSIFEDPQWQGNLACITCNENMNNGGTPVATNTDIDGNARSLTTPDMGALEFINPTSFSLGGDDTICGNEFTLESGPAQLVAWGVVTNNGANQNYSTPSITLTQQGGAPTTFDISITIISAYCGSGSDNATILLVPNATLDSSLHICADETATIAAGGSTTSTYLWSTGATASSIDVNEEGSYSVIKSELGCESEATTIVTKSVAIAIGDQDACKNDGPLEINASIPDGVSYAWSGGSNTGSATNTLTTAGNYSLTVTDSYGCVSSEDFVFSILDVPVAKISENHSGMVYFFDATNSTNVSSNTSFYWDFGHNGVTGTNATQAVAFPWSNPSNPTSYSVTLEIDNGCGTDDVSKSVKPDVLGSEEFVAGEFSIYPNPAFDLVRFELSAPISESGQLKIMDVTGRVVYTQIIGVGQTIGEFNISTLAAGSYLVEMSVDGTSFVNPIVKR